MLELSAARHLPDTHVRPHWHPHSVSAVEPAEAGFLTIHVKVVVALVQPYGDVEIAAQVVVAVRVRTGEVLLSSHVIPVP